MPKFLDSKQKRKRAFFPKILFIVVKCYLTFLRNNLFKFLFRVSSETVFVTVYELWRMFVFGKKLIFPNLIKMVMYSNSCLFIYGSGLQTLQFANIYF